MTPDRLAVIILAAGASRRFGSTDKLLHPVDGKPLAAHTAHLAHTIGARITCAVIPGDAPKRAGLFDQAGIDTLVNKDAAQGQGSSLALGIRHLTDKPVDAALILLADMPRVPLAHVSAMLNAAAEGIDAVASRTGEITQPPLLFCRPAFPALQALAGDTGGKAVLNRLSDVTAVDLPATEAIDIDTQADIALGGPAPAAPGPTRRQNKLT